MPEKTCSKCKKTKTLDHFYKDKWTKDGLAYECKNCAKERARLYYWDNREKGREYCRKYRETHKEQLREYRQRPENKEKRRLAKRSDAYRRVARAYAQRPDRKRKAREYKNTEKYKKYRREYKRRNSTKKKERERRCARMQNDPIYAVKSRTRNLIKESIRKRGYKKNTKTQEILGCPFEQLWARLLSTWEKNYGKPWDGEPYHIDHIVPLATARTKEDVIKLCHYTNLQMLTPEDNLRKGTKETLPAVD